MAIVDITGLDPIEVFRRLYNEAKPLGMGMLHYTPEDMTYEQAQKQFQVNPDYVNGRVMKITFVTDSPVAKDSGEPQAFFKSDWYNRDNGEAAAEMVIAKYRGELNRK